MLVDQDVIDEQVSQVTETFSKLCLWCCREQCECVKVKKKVHESAVQEIGECKKDSCVCFLFYLGQLKYIWLDLVLSSGYYNKGQIKD